MNQLSKITALTLISVGVAGGAFGQEKKGTTTLRDVFHFPAIAEP